MGYHINSIIQNQQIRFWVKELKRLYSNHLSEFHYKVNFLSPETVLTSMKIILVGHKSVKDDLTRWLALTTGKFGNENSLWCVAMICNDHLRLIIPKVTVQCLTLLLKSNSWMKSIPKRWLYNMAARWPQVNFVTKFGSWSLKSPDLIRTSFTMLPP